MSQIHLNPQTLRISSFGPITELEIKVDDLLIFIGSQASGKSTVSKAIFFFKSLKDELLRYLYQSYKQQKFDESVTDFAKQAKQKFIKIYGHTLQFPDMELKYDYGNGMVTTIKNSRYTDIIFDDYFRSQFRNLVQYLQQNYNQLQKQSIFLSSRELSAINAQESNLFDTITEEVNKLFNDEKDLLFLPAGRSVITTLSQQRYNIDLGDINESEIDSLNYLKLDYIMQNFISRIDNAKPLFNQSLADLIQDSISDSNNPEYREIIKLAQNIIDQILKGSYRYEDGIEKIEFGDGKETLINFASSGQQEVVWILLLILLLIVRKRPVFLVIEEPEAHLFPVTQKQIIDLIGLLANQSNNQVIVTTHSPYILSSFNNLLYAHQLGVKKSKKINEVVNHHCWIAPERLNAYILEDGTARSIMDTEVRLIESAEIDRASDIIVDTFNQLFELEDEE
ncbi:AAA family ATPase [Spirulina sp. CS-785/01]|uniref:AAA family ATPase n=1 Tax=Spirulina sp. CS-785/01 TaxID=3021716 RepID=UPI00232EB4C5|nr:AAA family ATPase [Spirulina sp. CS-785/01]MDB9315893.1 AAA family ATPase [Spirulina sp. CS-785/01]